MRKIYSSFVFLFLACGIISAAAQGAMWRCLACAPGTYSAYGSTTCTACPANHYCPGVADKIACPSGKSSPAGSIAADDCEAPTLTGPTGLAGKYCADTNKNVCTANTAWAGGSNQCGGGSWTAWDGTTTGTNPYKARQNSYDIKASTWACNTSSSVAPNATGDAQCRSGAYCWCAYSKSADTDPATFTSGAWSSWGSLGSYESASVCASICAGACALAAADSSGGAVVFPSDSYTPAQGFAVNKNMCIANAPWAGGSNQCIGGSWTAWDGTAFSATTGYNNITYKAQQNDYGIQNFTWACNTTTHSASGVTTGTNGSGYQIPTLPSLTDGPQCWCGYKSATQWSSTWAYVTDIDSASDCAYNCPHACAGRAHFPKVGGAVSW
jgi:hypothetical protein